MAKGKLKSSSSPSFAQGGSGHMFGQQHAGPMPAGQSGKGDGGGGGKWAQGGSGHMFGKQSASTKQAGTTGKP